MTFEIDSEGKGEQSGVTVWSPGVCEVPCREVKWAKQEQRSWFSKWMQYLLIVLRFNRIILIFFFFEVG